MPTFEVAAAVARRLSLPDPLALAAPEGLNLTCVAPHLLTYIVERTTVLPVRISLPPPGPSLPTFSGGLWAHTKPK